MRNLFLLFFLSILLAAPTLAKPAIFEDLTLNEAQKKASEADRWLLVDFSADWCVPCKKMDETTWQDPKVQEWVKPRAISIQLDLDENTELAKKLKIVGIPAILLFHNGQEVDRSTGLKTADQLLQWLAAVESGSSELSLLRAKVKEEPDSLEAWNDLADVLLQKGDYRESADIYRRLWDDMRGSEFSGVRLSYLIQSMDSVSQQSLYAQNLFGSLRANLEKKVLGQQAAAEDIVDWLAFKKHHKEENDILVWYKSLDDRWAPLYEKARPTLFRLFLKTDHLEQAGQVFPEPVSWVKEQLVLWDSLSENDEMMQGYVKRQAGSLLGGLFKSLNAVGRTDEAEEIKGIVLKHYNYESVKRAFE